MMVFALGSGAQAAVVQGAFTAKSADLSLAGVKGGVKFNSFDLLGGLSSELTATASGAFEIGDIVVAPGTLIGAATPMTKGVEVLDSTQLYGLFVDDRAMGNVLLPFEFTTGGGQTDYGWINLDVTKSLAFGRSHDAYSYTLEDFAYSDNGSDIGAGRLTTPIVSAAPEPSTWALMMAGVGGIGLALRRAKRDQSIESKGAFAV